MTSVKYRPGNEMVMSDVLSRLPNPSDKSDVQLDLKVDELSLDLVNFSSTKLQELRDETRRCPILNALAEVVYQGWPDKWLTYRLIFARSGHSGMNTLYRIWCPV